MGRQVSGDPDANDTRRRTVRRVAGLLVLLVAWIHLLHPQYGLSTMLLYAELGTIYDPRPPLFVLTGGALLAGAVLGYLGIRRRPLYAAGACLMVVYVAGYVAWHTVLDHGAFWPHLAGHGHEEVGVAESLGHHLRNDTIASVAKVTELILLVLLSYLLWVDRE
ncbi:hypothetical protein [Natronorarus salvus]|uniref:hypothetical protein n=1 Tax=Natronorarus salvus TaxID=3117733 RepID=UPI002F25FA6D